MPYFLPQNLESTLHVEPSFFFTFKKQSVFAGIFRSHWQESLSEAEPLDENATHAAGFSMKAEDLGRGAGQRRSSKTARLRTSSPFMSDLEISHGRCSPINNTCRLSRTSSKAIVQFLSPSPVWRRGPKPLM